MRTPVMPASVKNSAQIDHRYAAPTPTEISVSIVAAPWRRLAHAARWKGSAPQTTTGEARVSESHCQLSNCSAGTMDISRTGRARTPQTTSRWRQACASASRLSCPRSPPGGASAAGGAGRVALYPVASTVATRSSGATPGAKLTLAFSVA